MLVLHNELTQFVLVYVRQVKQHKKQVKNIESIFTSHEKWGRGRGAGWRGAHDQNNRVLLGLERQKTSVQGVPAGADDWVEHIQPGNRGRAD